jgi:histidinol-phosphate aminotransferase
VAAAIATLRHEDEIRARGARLRAWTAALARDLRALGIRTFPTETYFFLADFAPRVASEIAAGLRDRNILVKPFENARLGPGYMRITTALPEENTRFVSALRELLPGGGRS